MDQVLSAPCEKPGWGTRLGLALLFAALGASAPCEGIRVEPKVVGQSRGQDGPTAVLQFAIGEASYRSLGTPGWKWTSDAMGFDAAALGPGTGVAVIGVRVEKLRNAKGEPIEKRGPEAWSALRRKWDGEVADGKVRIIAWDGGPDSEEVAVRFTRVEDGRELAGRERCFFGEGRLITLGMLADARQLGMAEAMFAQFNGSFAKIEP